MINSRQKRIISIISSAILIAVFCTACGEKQADKPIDPSPTQSAIDTISTQQAIVPEVQQTSQQAIEPITEEYKRSEEIITEQAATPAVIMQAEPQMKIPESDEKIYLGKNEKGLYLVNKVDGYAFVVPDDSKLDISRMEAETIFQNDNIEASVFTQKLKTDASKNNYIKYSLNFLKNNPTEHILISDDTATVNKSLSIRTVKWTRPLLSKIEDDKNCYTAMFLKTPDAIYHLLIRSKPGFDDTDICQTVKTSFQTIEQTESANTFLYTPLCNSDNFSSMHDASTTEFYNRVFIQSDKPTWGIFHSTDTNDEPLSSLEAKIDYHFDIYLDYRGISNSFNFDSYTNKVKSIQNEGRTYELTLQPPNYANGTSPVYAILDGKNDSYLSELADFLKSLHHPVLLRICNEMNGDWCNYCAYHYSDDAHLYRAMYSYIMQYLKDQDVKNVIWIWNPNEKSFPSYKWNNAVLYYPNEGSDVYGITGYNTGTYYSGGETWRSFEEIYDPIYKDAERRAKIPMMITEFSCSGIGGDKAAWIEDMFNKLPSYPKIKAAVWWNSCDFDNTQDLPCISREYRLTEDCLTIFKNHLN